MLIKTFPLTIAIASVSTSALAANKVIIIGGGPYPRESQVSIELNTKWIIDGIKGFPSEKITKILYTDGNNPHVDVYKHTTINDQNKLYEPLARVYGKERNNTNVFFSSKINGNSGPTTYKSVVTALSSSFQYLRAGDSIFLIFQGHGDYNPNNTNNNYFRLWNDGKLTVTDLGNLMSGIPKHTTVRFLFPQCFSGSFTNLMYKQLDPKKGLTNSNICGFVAQRADLTSEGCTPSIETSTYRDYSSYLFSALFGRTIDGKPLTVNPDINQDGSVSLREAHLYTLGHAYSVDLSASTSEDYLRNWLPWYFKWIPDNSEPDNIYMKTASTIAARYKLAGTGNLLIQSIAKKMKQLNARLDKDADIRHSLANEIKMIQRSMRRDLSRRWPQLASPYTAQYIQLLKNDIAEIDQYIEKHNNYSELVRKQNKEMALTSSDLNTRRDLVQMLKILRLRKLGRTLALFNKYATDHEKTEYARLVNCEDEKL